MFNRQIDLFQILKEQNQLQSLLVYQAKLTIDDPFEQTKTKVLQNPLPVQGIVRQISQEALRWKYYGKVPAMSIEVIAELKYESLFKTAEKIIYDGNTYHTMKDDSQNFVITKRTDYIIVVLGLNPND
jgi:hypothetical protein